ncbi:chromosomal replication initiator protein [Novimethylophilus kurashikiensis]|uniref:Chromosomal replication initiator protein DnaA n=1 Tax=Novimethylophilus kurashikiensis TaxID=1825523 RepID=A0A2R5F885_9PROT|nr:chromosomal replication initiator protein DnaA [Novimethylophilus kurashikiensis]GBG13768.1 chromosomal replication initiator protein [Novimethylophilus kurashikiensis]
MENFWFACLGRFERELSSMQFNTLIKPLKLDDSDECLRIVAPNRFVMQSIKDKFLDRIHQLGQDFFSRPISVELVLSDDAADQELPPVIAAPPAPEPVASQSKKVKPGSKTDTSGLNPSLTFSNFVTGKANQLARAAALQVAENPGGAYNPLFVYGGVGLGKTHMIQAIGNHLRSQRPDARISYLHAEKYVSDVVKAYQHKAFDEFKKRYHSLDLLLIDDIQFFAGKGRTQEEFFYAFESLIGANKQIVITCDTLPKEISGIEDRLKTRFSWGLTVVVEPPELEMRVAILIEKANAAKIRLEEDVAFLIAKHIRSSVRDLEGALNRVIAMANFTGKSIDTNLVKDALKDIIGRVQSITIESIQKTVADYYKIKVAEMYSQKRSRNIARPRQIAMALARDLTNSSFPEIGEAFGGRDHTTVMHACKKIDSLKSAEPTLVKEYNLLLQVLRGD